MAEGGGGTIAALSSAQRYPDDYDTIAVTGMSSYLTRHTFGQMWIWQATHKDAASFIPPEKYEVLHKAALDACDALDGLKDGIIGDVRSLQVRSGRSTLCKAGDGDRLPDGAASRSGKKIYAGPHNPSTGEEIYSPLYPGSELGWGQLAGGDAPLGIPVEFFKYYVFRDPSWDYKTRPINFDSDVTASNRAEIQPVNAVDPDLGKFFARGGKLLLVDGWADTAVPPKVAINYYNAVVKNGSARRRSRNRCGSSWCPAWVTALAPPAPRTSTSTHWVSSSNGRNRERRPISLSSSITRRARQIGTRLVCQYPQVAMYKGSGDAENSASYSCK